MPDIQHRPKRRIYAGEFVPVSKETVASAKELRKRASAWLKARGLQTQFNGFKR